MRTAEGQQVVGVGTLFLDHGSGKAGLEFR